MDIEEVWTRTSQFVLGGDVGSLKDNYDFLTYYYHKPLSINNTFVPFYYEQWRNVQAFSQNINMDVNINDIKDVDNLFNKAKEYFFVLGEKVLGKSDHVSRSTNVINGQHVLESNTVVNSRFIAYSSYIYNGEYVFGTHDVANSKFLINSVAIGGQGVRNRVFESFMVLGENSDIFYSHNVSGCKEVMFSFFQRGKRFVIGNKVLSKEQYNTLKQHLLEQIRDDIRAKKGKHLAEIFEEVAKDMATQFSIDDSKDKPPQPQLVNAYKTLTNVLFGSSRSLEEDKEFLTQNLLFYDLFTVKNEFGETVTGGSSYYKIKQNTFALQIPEQRVVEMSKRTTDVDYDNLIQSLKPIMFLHHNIEEQCSYSIDSPICYSASFNYYTFMPVFSKFTAFSFWPRTSSYVFGSSTVFDSQMVIRSYNSQKLSRAFECDSSTNVQDAYYCFACENSRNVMFSFGVIGRSNVILNTTVDTTTFNRVKSYLQEFLAHENRVPRVYELNVFK
jgi:hypothetical protein